MASQGPNYPGIAVSESDTPYDDEPWLTPENVGADDGAYCRITSRKLDPGLNSYVVKATNYGFNIPVGATIDGIVVEFERYGVQPEVEDVLIQLVKGGTRQGDNKSVGAIWPTSETIETFGSSTVLWGLSWSPSDINATGFGVAVACTCTAGQKDAKPNIDFLRITVYYTTEAAPVEKNTSDTGGGSDSFLKEREVSITTFGNGSEVTLKEREATVALSGGGAVLLLPLKERGLSDIGGGSEGLSKFVLAEKFIGDVGGGVDVVSLLKIVSRTVSDVAGGVVALIRERDIFLVETASGLVALLKERFITVSELGGGSDATVRSAVLSKAVGDVGGGAELASKETGIVKKKKKRGWPWQYRD